jgi:hypothetical protein
VLYKKSTEIDGCRLIPCTVNLKREKAKFNVTAFSKGKLAILTDSGKLLSSYALTELITPAFSLILRGLSVCLKTHGGTKRKCSRKNLLLISRKINSWTYRPFS